MKKILKLVLFLSLVAAASGLILGYIDSVTKPLIEEAAIKAENAKLEKMYPGVEFKKVGEDLVDGKTILAIYEASTKGYIFKLWGKGYSNNGITILASLDYDGTIQKIVPLEQQETRGFGAKVFDMLDVLYYGTTIDEEIDMLSGATLTSRSMKQMLNAAKDAYRKLR